MQEGVNMATIVVCTCALVLGIIIGVIMTRVMDYNENNW